MKRDSVLTTIAYAFACLAIPFGLVMLLALPPLGLHLLLLSRRTLFAWRSQLAGAERLAPWTVTILVFGAGVGCWAIVRAARGDSAGEEAISATVLILIGAALVALASASGFTGANFRRMYSRWPAKLRQGAERGR